MRLLYMVTIYPIETLIEIIFITIQKMFENHGIAVIGLSFVMSILTFPLYQIAESLQKRERDIKTLLRPKVERIRAVFSGDERFMILSTLYRQHHYHPVYALRTSLGLLIQIPFFVAAYQFLSHLDALQGMSFLFIRDLGKPDQLFEIGSVTLNVLPILMTVCNIGAGVLYSKGFHKSEKIQLYGIAFLFLLLLYKSPSALVLYWTLNNLFSFAKNFLINMNNPWKLIYVTASVLSIIGSIIIVIINPWIAFYKILLLGLICLSIVFSPWLIQKLTSLYDFFLRDFSKKTKERKWLFGLSIFSLLMLSGLLVPTNLIASSPTEFAFAGSVDNPLFFIGTNFAVFFGLLAFWGVLLFLLFGEKTKSILSVLLVSATIISYINLFFLDYDLGTVNVLLQIEEFDKVFPSNMLVVIGLIVVVLTIGVVLTWVKLGRTGILVGVLAITGIASLGGGVFNIVRIQQDYSVYRINIEQQPESIIDQDENISPVYTFSESGKNVFILILDRAVNSYFPLVMEQQVGLSDSFKGFVYYPNTVSSGAYTITGTPPIMAGYEYTPDKMNLRSDETLVDKHNEALLMLPKNFLEAGFSVTLTDPPLPNYQWEGDLSPFNTYPEMRVRQLEGDYTQAFLTKYPDPLDTLEDESIYIKKYLPRFSLMKITTPLFRPVVYDEGDYLSTVTFKDEYWRFIKAYSQLYLFKELTEVAESGDTFTIMHNNTTHEPVFLEAPAYEPKKDLTNTESPISGISGVTDFDITMYHVNAAALRKVGEWLDYLKELGVYDNSRIIILSDHGRNVYTPAFASFEQNQRAYAYYNALLLMKDFNASNELQTDMSFMTTADTPILAINDLEVSEINSFTGNNLYEMVDKKSVGMYFTNWNPVKGNTFTFDNKKSFFVHDNIFEESNWSPVNE